MILGESINQYTYHPGCTTREMIIAFKQPGIILSLLNTLIHVILTITLPSKYYYYSRFIEKQQQQQHKCTQKLNDLNKDTELVSGGF